MSQKASKQKLDPEIKQKISNLKEATQWTEEDLLVALEEVNFDEELALDNILTGKTTQWESSTKKKPPKSQQSSENKPKPNRGRDQKKNSNFNKNGGKSQNVQRGGNNIRRNYRPRSSHVPNQTHSQSQINEEGNINPSEQKNQQEEQVQPTEQQHTEIMQQQQPEQPTEITFESQSNTETIQSQAPASNLDSSVYPQPQQNQQQNNPNFHHLHKQSSHSKSSKTTVWKPKEQQPGVQTSSSSSNHNVHVNLNPPQQNTVEPPQNTVLTPSLIKPINQQPPSTTSPQQVTGPVVLPASLAALARSDEATYRFGNSSSSPSPSFGNVDKSSSNLDPSLQQNRTFPKNIVQNNYGGSSHLPPQSQQQQPSQQTSQAQPHSHPHHPQSTLQSRKPNEPPNPQIPSNLVQMGSNKIPMGVNPILQNPEIPVPPGAEAHGMPFFGNSYLPHLMFLQYPPPEDGMRMPIYDQSFSSQGMDSSKFPPQQHRGPYPPKLPNGRENSGFAQENSNSSNPSTPQQSTSSTNANSQTNQSSTPQHPPFFPPVYPYYQYPYNQNSQYFPQFYPRNPPSNIRPFFNSSSQTPYGPNFSEDVTQVPYFVSETGMVSSSPVINPSSNTNQPKLSLPSTQSNQNKSFPVGGTEKQTDQDPNRS